ncbi:auxin-responsive protein SAUR40-like [Zingiber officinale]|uniref:auxin-responsive protein SAUR40-like n=1 Tax=Zingiber officinale TaxID=94328 RepID=UPI001C4B59A7|nr:auxin-responsive protein SAUR40-like [Zingiber officinale]
MAIGMTSLVRKLLVCGCGGGGAVRNFPEAETAAGLLPEGHIWVVVGTEGAAARRMEVEANYLNHRLMEDLLRLSVPEFGYSYGGALRVACDADFFLYLLDLLRSSDPAVHYMDLSDLMATFAGAGSRTEFFPTHRPLQRTIS